MHKLVYLTNVVVLDNVFSFKSSNPAITNCGFEFDSIAIVLDSGILIFKFLQFLLSKITTFESFI